MAEAGRTLIAVRGLRKSFGATEVLKGVGFTVRAGEIHALLGGNGAGKSTIIRIITGTLRPNGGELTLASGRGASPVISVVHQELALLPDLTVAENIGVVHARSGLSRFSGRRASTIAADALRIIDPHMAEFVLHRKADSLTLHQGQIVEIARALSTGAEVLLMDEPTANLTAAETGKLFKVLRQLAEENAMGIVFVSHRMKEIRQLCDVCTIIRDGHTVVDARRLDTLSDAEIVQQMGQPAHKASQTPLGRGDARPVGVRLKGPEVDLPVSAGTILGLAGAPAGPVSVIAALTGASRDAAWSLSGEGWPERPRSPKEAVQDGIGYVSGDRAAKGVLAQLPIIDNVLASRRVKEERRLVARRERAECAALVTTLKVKAASLWDLPGTLSGGNQQKLLISRWLDMPLRMVVFEEPTRGVDIGTKRDIYELIRQMAARGTIVVWWSTENVELIELCDEILAFDTEGRPKGLLSREAFTEDSLSELTGMAA